MSELPDLPVLSIRQPWAWLILHGGKDIENRSWPTGYRGRFLIHAAKGMTVDEYIGAEYDANLIANIILPERKALERGGIIGSVDLVRCVFNSNSPWFGGHGYGFELRDPRPLPFHPCRGRLGFFRLSREERRVAP